MSEQMDKCLGRGQACVCHSFCRRAKTLKAARGEEDTDKNWFCVLMCIKLLWSIHANSSYFHNVINWGTGETDVCVSD